LRIVFYDVPMHKPAREQLLYRFLRDALPPSDLRAFVFELGGRDAEAELPGDIASPAQLAHAATEVLTNRGHLNQALFEELAAKAPPWVYDDLVAAAAERGLTLRAEMVQRPDDAEVWLTRAGEWLSQATPYLILGVAEVLHTRVYRPITDVRMQMRRSVMISMAGVVPLVTLRMLRRSDHFDLELTVSPSVSFEVSDLIVLAPALILGNVLADLVSVASTRALLLWTRRKATSSRIALAAAGDGAILIVASGVPAAVVLATWHATLQFNTMAWFLGEPMRGFLAGLLTPVAALSSWFTGAPWSDEFAFQVAVLWLPTALTAILPSAVLWFCFLAAAVAAPGRGVAFRLLSRLLSARTLQ
jgi:uncharacterized membrane protein